MIAHTHSVSRSETRPYDGTASNQAAAGNVTEHETCRCGARRVVHVNGRHFGVHEWDLPEWVADVNPEAIPFSAADGRRLLAALAQSSAGRRAIERAGYGAILDAPTRGDDHSTLAVARTSLRALRELGR